MRLVLVYRHQVLSDVVLDVVGDLEAVHGCVGVVQAFLEIDVFFVHFLHENGHLTEDGGVDDG